MGPKVVKKMGPKCHKNGLFKRFTTILDTTEWQIWASFLTDFSVSYPHPVPLKVAVFAVLSASRAPDPGFEVVFDGQVGHSGQPGSERWLFHRVFGRNVQN